ncbi:uncharacterized protein [Halyomorpha halys]|uniref:uncharacterized protein isoform X2 n=1 Tax=Halyomorpha halys TaxID=286706 RepID=UPI0034D1B9D1
MRPKKEIKDPILFLERLLEWMGVVSISEDQKPWYYTPMVVLQHISHVNGLLATSLYVLDDNPFFSKMESAQYFISLLHMVAKYYNLHYNNPPYRRLIANAKYLWQEAKKRPRMNNLLAELSQDVDKKMKFFFFIFAMVSPASCLVTLIANLMQEPEERGKPFVVWDPVPESWYWTSCFIEGWCMMVVLSMLGTTLVACYGNCLQAATQMRVLQQMLEDSPLDLRACVQLHQNILRYIEDINDYFSGQMFLEIVFSSLQTAIRGYVSLKKEKLFISAYNNAWYSASPREKSSLVILLCQASKIKRLNYKNLLDFNMERYSVVVQGTYSYITLLQGADL